MEAGESEWVAGAGHQTLALQVFGTDRPDVVMLSCATPTTEHFVVDVHDVISTLGNDRKESQATVSAMHATPFGDGGLDATPDGRETPGRWRAPVVSFVHAKRRSATRADGEDTSMPSVCVCRPPYADQALPTDRHAMRSETQLAAIRDAFVDASATATRFLLRVGDVLILDSNHVFHGMDPDNDKDARLHRLWVWTSHRPGDVPACLDQAMDDEALWMVPHQMPRRADDIDDDIDDDDEEEEDPIPGLAELRGTYVGEGGMNAGTTSVSESEAAAVYAAAGIAPGARVGAAASLLLEAPAAPRETQLDPFGRVIPELRGTRCVSLLFGGVATMTGFADGRLLADTDDTTLIDLASSLCEFDLARWTRESTVQVPLSSAVIAEAPAPATDFASRRDARRRARGGGGGDVAGGITTTTTTTTTTTNHGRTHRPARCGGGANTCAPSCPETVSGTSAGACRRGCGCIRMRLRRIGGSLRGWERK
ncbi:TauD domain-containing protein [Pycnococcus provasolii]